MIASLPALPPTELSRFRRLRLSFGLDKNRAGVAVDRGDQARNAGDWRAAAFAYAEGLSFDPKLTHIWVQFGHALKEAGDLVSAERAYRIALDHEPTNGDTFLNLGHALKLQGRMSDASLAYMRALELEGLARHSTIELAGLARNAHDFSLEALAEALGAGVGDQSSVILHVTRLLNALFSGAPSAADLASMRLVTALIDSGEDVLLCGARGEASELRRLPASLLGEAFRAMLEARADKHPGSEVLVLLDLIAASGAPCVFRDGAVVVDFAGGDAEGRFDAQLRVLRRAHDIRTLVYLPATAQALTEDGDAASRELFAAMPQTLAFVVDHKNDAHALLAWSEARGLRLRDDALLILPDESADWPAAIVAVARGLASPVETTPSALTVAPDLYYGLGRDPEAEQAAGPALARCGEGWWWPEAWGCWTRAGGASLLIDPSGEPGEYELLIGLRSSLEGACRFEVSLGDVVTDSGVLAAARTDWRSIPVEMQTGPVRLKVVGADTHNQGPGGAASSIGVIGFAIRSPRAQNPSADVSATPVGSSQLRSGTTPATSPQPI